MEEKKELFYICCDDMVLGEKKNQGNLSFFFFSFISDG